MITHGELSDVNSHPYFNKEKTIAVVHNGVIENYLELREELQGEGYVFLSQTDTEVVVTWWISQETWLNQLQLNSVIKRNFCYYIVSIRI